MSIYMFLTIDQMVQGYRGVNINGRHNEESLGEMYRKDDIDAVSYTHLTLPTSYAV